MNTVYVMDASWCGKLGQEARQNLGKYINLFYVNSGHLEPFPWLPRASNAQIPELRVVYIIFPRISASLRHPEMLEFRNFLETNTRIFGGGLSIEKVSWTVHGAYGVGKGFRLFPNVAVN